MLVTNSSYQNPNKPTATLEDLKQEKATLLVYCIAQIHPDNTETSLITQSSVNLLNKMSNQLP